MSAQKQEQLPTLDVGLLAHASHVGLTLLQGGLSTDKLAYGEMPTPKVDDIHPISEALPFDCPPAKFENGGTHLPHDTPIQATTLR